MSVRLWLMRLTGMAENQPGRLVGLSSLRPCWRLVSVKKSEADVVPR